MGSPALGIPNARFGETASGILLDAAGGPAKRVRRSEGRQALERGMAIDGSKHDRRGGGGDARVSARAYSTAI
jgi:hypothetical protein